MGFRFAAIAAAVCLSASIHVHAQTADLATGPDIAKLQGLRTVLGRAHTVCGTGTLTTVDFKGNQTPFPFHVCASRRAMRGDTTLPMGVLTVVFNGTVGIVRSPDGTHFKLTGRNTMLWRPIYFPPLLVDSVLADAKFQVKDDMTTDKTGQGHHLHLQRSELVNKSSDISKDADDLALQIDPTTQFASSFSWSHSYEGVGMQHKMFPASVAYSNYTTISGVALPQTITKTEFGKVRSIITFTSLQVDPTIPEGFFSLKKEELQ